MRLCSWICACTALLGLPRAEAGAPPDAPSRAPSSVAAAPGSTSREVRDAVVELQENRDDLGAESTFTTVALVSADRRHWLVERRGGDAELMQEELAPRAMQDIARAVRDPEIRALPPTVDLRANALVVEPRACRLVFDARTVEVVGDLARDPGARERAPAALLRLYDIVRTPAAELSTSEPGAWIVELVPATRAPARSMPLFAPESEAVLTWPIGLRTPSLAKTSAPGVPADLTRRARFDLPDSPDRLAATDRASWWKDWLALRRAARERRPVEIGSGAAAVQYTVILSPLPPKQDAVPARGEPHPAHRGF